MSPPVSGTTRVRLDLGHWIFDLDGTLTVAVHDFTAIRRLLGLPAGEPILEALGRLPPDEAGRLAARLEQHELELARRARPQSGACELLTLLRERGARLGIVTRNSHGVALETLRVCGLHDFFDAEDVIGRECAAPKPDPDGVERLLRRWGVVPRHAVMVGDYLFDLQAGRAAGTTTVYLDVSAQFPWAAHADHTVSGLAVLRGLIDGVSD